MENNRKVRNESKNIRCESNERRMKKSRSVLILLTRTNDNHSKERKDETINDGASMTKCMGME